MKPDPVQTDYTRLGRVLSKNLRVFIIIIIIHSLLNVTVHQHYAETQDRRLRGSETGSTLPSYISDTVKY